MPTENQLDIREPMSRRQVETLRANCREFGVTLYDINSGRQGIVHVIGPELGLTLPGTTIVCGDSHTSTHGAFGALAFGIGTSEVEHVLATQTLWQGQAADLVRHRGHAASSPRGWSRRTSSSPSSAQIGTGGATGTVLEYYGPAIAALSMEGRMTVCNMSIEAGARAGLIAPDDTTIQYIATRRPPVRPQGRGARRRHRRLEDPADRRPLGLRPPRRHRRRQDRPAGHLGDQPGDDRRRDRPRPRARPGPVLQRARTPAGPWTTWA